MDLREICWGECRLDPVGSGQGPMAGSCEYGDEPSGSGATELLLAPNYNMTKNYAGLTNQICVPRFEKPL
jgi:hypothetical protein